MPEPLLRLDDIIHLQPKGEPTGDRCPVRLIGLVEGRSLLVTSAEPRSFQFGEKYVARCLSGKNIYGFATEVIKVTVDPFPYLHLSYPHNPQCVGVRQAERVRVSIPVEIRGDGGTHHAATLTNLSHSGAQLAVEKALGKAGDKLTLNFELAFAGLCHRMVSTVVIKSLREDAESAAKKQCLHGVHFEGHSDQEHLMLHGFVYEQIAAGRMVA